MRACLSLPALHIIAYHISCCWRKWIIIKSRVANKRGTLFVLTTATFLSIWITERIQFFKWPGYWLLSSHWKLSTKLVVIIITFFKCGAPNSASCFLFWFLFNFATPIMVKHSSSLYYVMPAIYEKGRPPVTL